MKNFGTYETTKTTKVPEPKYELLKTYSFAENKDEGLYPFMIVFTKAVFSKNEWKYWTADGENYSESYFNKRLIK